MIAKIKWKTFFICVLMLATFATCDLIEDQKNERVKSAQIMASYLDTSSNPCDDFYQFACGNYFTVHKRPGQKLQFVFGFMEYDMENDFHDILMEPVTTSTGEKNELSAGDKARLYYQSCMKVDLFSFPKSETYLRLIESLGGWPVLSENWNSDNFDWFNVTLEGYKYGVRTFLDVTYYKVNEFLEVFSGFSFRGLHQSVLFKPYSIKYQTAKKIATKIMMIYGASKNDADCAFDEIIEFAKKWNELSIELERDNSIFNKTAKNDEEQTQLDQLRSFVLEKNLFKRYKRKITVGELYELIPEIDFKSALLSYIGRDIDLSHKIAISVPEYYKKIASLFQDQKYKRGMANYAFLKFLLKFHDEYEELQYQKSYCIKKVKDVLEEVLSALYMNSKFYNRNIESEILEMLSYIKATFKDTITSTTWLDTQTKQKALSKLQSISFIIGDPNDTLNMNKMTKHYRDLNITSLNNYYENNLEILKFDHLNEVGNPSSDNYTTTNMYKTNVNAAYDQYENKLDLEAGIIRKPAYNTLLPKSYNYGALGVILAHEVMHAFDPSSRLHNEKGEEEDWWSDESSEEYEKRIQCLTDQYTNFTNVLSPIYVDGEMSITEIAADNGGIRQGYYAYEKWLKEHDVTEDDSTSQYLSGLNFTSSKQLFFLSTAQMFCSNRIRPNGHVNIMELLRSDPHYDGVWRVNGGFSNFDEFSRVFNCKLGSKMNPVDKCVIW